MMGDNKGMRYLGTLVAMCALGAFAGTAVADDSGTATTGTDTQEAVVASVSGDPASGPADDGTSGDAAETTAADTESTAEPPPAETTTSSDSTTHETTTSDNTETNSGGCTSESVTNTSLSVGSASATGTFSVAAGCPGIRVTLASFTKPGNTMFPQDLFASSTGIFAAGGPYTLSVALPSCFFQVDLIRGTVPNQLTDFHPPGGVAVRWAFGGTTACGTTPPPVTTTSPTTTSGPTTPGTTSTTTPTETTTTTTTTTPTTTAASPTTTTAGVAGTEAGGSKGNSNVLGVAAAAAHLPFTGLSLALIAAIGALLLLLGVGMKVAGRRRGVR
jgi:hypothetical protein